MAPWKFANFQERVPGEHIEDRMAAEAVAWMEQHRDRPFYLNYWMFSVHAPFDAKKSLIEKHRGRVNPADPQRSPTYAAMVESMDDAVGTLLDALDRLQLADHTIIIFTSDNGGNMYDEVDGTTPTSNAPLRGGKATLFEGGTRVPGIIVWPGLTAAGSRSDAIIQSEDYYPTLLAGLGLQAAPEQRFDGVSILPALQGRELAREAVFQYFPHNPGVPDWLPPAVSVHRGDWKLIRIFHGGENGAHRYLLFNLRDDLSEKNNLAAQKPELVSELDALITHFLADTKAVVPVPNPAFDPAQYHPELEGRQKPRTKPNPRPSRRQKMMAIRRCRAGRPAVAPPPSRTASSASGTSRTPASWASPPASIAGPARSSCGSRPLAAIRTSIGFPAACRTSAVRPLHPAPWRLAGARDRNPGDRTAGHRPHLPEETGSAPRDRLDRDHVPGQQQSHSHRVLGRQPDKPANGRIPATAERASVERCAAPERAPGELPDQPRW